VLIRATLSWSRYHVHNLIATPVLAHSSCRWWGLMQKKLRQKATSRIWMLSGAHSHVLSVFVLAIAILFVLACNSRSVQGRDTWAWWASTYDVKSCLMSALYLKTAQINARQLFPTQLALYVPFALAEGPTKPAIFVCTSLSKLHVCYSWSKPAFTRYATMWR
jgi:hypothetical protein